MTLFQSSALEVASTLIQLQKAFVSSKRQNYITEAEGCHKNLNSSVNKKAVIANGLTKKAHA